MKFKKTLFALLVFLLICLTVFVIDYIFKNSFPEVIREINAGVIGAIITTIITFLLLSNQTESAEKQVRNSEVYKEKIKSYNQLLDTIISGFEDGVLNPIEARKILLTLERAQVHLPDNHTLKIEKALSRINPESLMLDKRGINISADLFVCFSEICSVLRQDLYPKETNISRQDKSFYLSFLNLSELPSKIVDRVGSIDELINILSANKEILYVEDNKEKVEAPRIFRLNDDDISMVEKVANSLIQQLAIDAPEAEISIVLRRYSYFGKSFYSRFYITVGKDAKIYSSLAFNHEQVLNLKTSFFYQKKFKSKVSSIEDPSVEISELNAYKMLLIQLNDPEN